MLVCTISGTKAVFPPRLVGDVNLTNLRKLAIFVIGLPLVIALGSAFLLTAIFGPSDLGVQCVRSPEPECRILQTHFFGLLGNRSFSVPETAILGVKTVRSRSAAGRQSAPVFTVNLVLTPGSSYPDYPVLSYALESQAESATNKLSAYFKDKSAPSILIKDDVLTPVVLEGLAPVALLGGVVFAVWLWRFRKAKLQTS